MKPRLGESCHNTQRDCLARELRGIDRPAVCDASKLPLYHAGAGSYIHAILTHPRLHERVFLAGTRPPFRQMMLAQIADRLILQPTRHPIAAQGKVRRLLHTDEGFIEAWTQRVGATQDEHAEVFILKFSGTGGRAERTSHQPLDHWSDLKGIIWSVNPPGYGRSSGRASLRKLGIAASAAYEELAKLASGRPVIVTGNSLGTVMALYLAAKYRVHGLVLRNPPPLRQLIVGKHGWWNLWVGAMLVSAQVPRDLCSIANASRCINIPAVFVGSGRDRVVPPRYQAQVFRAYAGPKRIMCLREADHGTALNESEQLRYGQELQWLRERALPASPSFPIGV